MPPPRRPPPPVAQSVTTAPAPASDDSEARIRRYLLTMGIRTTCFILMVVFDGWLRWTFAAGAAFLPYVAVLFANARRPRIRGQVSPLTAPSPAERGRLGR
ncbi:MAG TPA: DUF3099 domain-containing protein [Dermatophilaceae bacterium]|nr:DUF3099 domain-containing protein [Dermatophilaceae bacterium]